MPLNTTGRVPSHLLRAIAAGLLWGIALPEVWGVVFVLAGAAVLAPAVGHAPKTDALVGAVAGTVWMAVAFRWLPETIALYGAPGPWPVWAALAVLQGAPLAAPTWVGGALVRREVPRPLALAVAWLALTEPLLVLQPVPDPLATALAGASVLLWPAALGGAGLLSAVAVGVGAALPARPGWLGLSAWAVPGLVAAWLPTTPSTVRVGLVQPDTEAFDGRRSSTADARAERLLAHVRAARDEGAAWVVTPESSWPFDPGAADSAARRRAEAAWSDLPPTVFGVTFGDGPTNSLIAVEEGQIRGRFDKEIRVPLSERAVWGLGTDAFVAGTGPRRLTLAGVPLGPLVCFEDLHPAALRAAVAHEPTFLLAATNDVWTGPAGGTDWHLAASRLAAVSTRRAVLRPTTSGRSAVIDVDGSLLWHTPWVDGASPDAKGRHAVVDVPARMPAFSGAALGPWWSLLAALYALISASLRR